MIEGPNDDGENLVQVSAQVMTRDESTGGWVPMGGGGLSNVKLCKLTPVEDQGSNGEQQLSTSVSEKYRIKPEYVIYGERIADNSVILDCRLKKDIQYTKANPKWHHWKTDEKRYGLTFERSEDAKAFDHGIRAAVKDLTEGLNDGNAAAEVDESIFQYVSLPGGVSAVPRSASWSRSASTTSTTTSSPGTNSPQSPCHHDPFLYPTPSHPHLNRIHYISHERAAPRIPKINALQQQQPPLSNPHPHLYVPPSDKSSFGSRSSTEGDVWVRPSTESHSLAVVINGKSDQGDSDRDYKDFYRDESYVMFERDPVPAANTPHEYSYPNLEPAPKNPAIRQSSTKKISSTSTTHTQQPYPRNPPLLPIKKSKNKSGGGDGKSQSSVKNKLISSQVQCKNCRENFSQDNNPRGSCEDAPDAVASCIECVTCVSCTSCLMYHCMSDADGEFRHPCSCDTSDPNHCKRWTALTLLSMVFPCLWCYLPLRACHRCGAMCGVCGGQHKAA